VTRRCSAIWILCFSASLILITGCGSSAPPAPTPNPVPAVTSLSPPSVTAGAAGQTLTINGTGFLSSSTVTYNGAAHTAIFVSATQLTISLTVSDQAIVGSFPVVVTNPSPGGGASNSSTFTVNSPILVSDSVNNRVLIYAAPFSSDESASVVLGQTGFTTATAPPTPTAATMNMPVDAVEDSAGNIYVSDQVNNRVLQFQPPFSNGMNASLVIGQPGFGTKTPNATQNGLNTPGGLAFDKGGNLWVVDFNNNRVLQYKPPFATGMNASLVIGQANFTASGAATTSSGLSSPFYIAFDASGDLWVADAGNNRVLEFMAPLATNGMAASLIIGQANFTSAGAAAPPTAGSLNGPAGIAFDSTGNLWIGDLFNNRVLEFIPSFTTGMNASLVLGQTLFTTTTAPTPPTVNSLSAPVGVAFDLSGNLWIADSANNRTLEFVPPFSDFQNRSVLGQANFTSAAAPAPPTATSQNSPSTARAAP
jgi:sugar lactone lactonase YvrE